MIQTKTTPETMQNTDTQTLTPKTTTETMTHRTRNQNRPLTPTKESPIFTAECNSYPIEESIYKDYEVDAGDYISRGSTFAVDYDTAVNDLHKWLKENTDHLTKENWFISMIDGSLNKDGEIAKKVVYSITTAKAKQYLF